MKPAVILPSHIPSPTRRTARPAKFEHAAKQHRKTAQSVTFKLCDSEVKTGMKKRERGGTDHPLSHGEALQGPILGVLERQICDVEEGTVCKQSAGERAGEEGFVAP